MRTYESNNKVSDKVPPPRKPWLKTERLEEIEAEIQLAMRAAVFQFCND